MITSSRFEVGRFEIAPQLDVDFVDGDQVLVFGVTIGRGSKEHPVMISGYFLLLRNYRNQKIGVISSSIVKDMPAMIAIRRFLIRRRRNNLVGSNDQLEGFASSKESATGVQLNIDRHDFSSLQLLLRSPFLNRVPLG